MRGERREPGQTRYVSAQERDRDLARRLRKTPTSDAVSGVCRVENSSAGKEGKKRTMAASMRVASIFIGQDCGGARLTLA
jgi:hypothetical protein